MAREKNIRLKKTLGQHFLKDEAITSKIADTILENAKNIPVVEVGPGAGALSEKLVELPNFKLVEYDDRWAKQLKEKFPRLEKNILNEDFLQINFEKLTDSEIAVVGNFPYNISSQILFKVLDNKEKVPLVIGMFQKEVAQRICSKEGNKTYGITSVLIQLYYKATYLFDVQKESFNPPPKVTSGVLMLERRENLEINFNEKLFKQIVKIAFNQRRKVMRNSLKTFLTDEIKPLEIFSLRPETLSVNAFINLTNIIDTTIKE